MVKNNLSDSKISIGIFLPKEELKKEKLKIFSEIRDWVSGIEINKLVVAAPNLKGKIGKNVKDFFSDNEIKLVLEDGRERFIGKIKGLLKRLEQNQLSLDEMDESFLEKEIDDLGELDIIIKFGEKRLPKNFIWEKGYSELFFVDKIEKFDKNRFRSIIKEFRERDRRFGA